MPRIRFVRDVRISGGLGPAGHESRLSFAAGEVIEVEPASRNHFVSRGAAIEEVGGEVPAACAPEPSVRRGRGRPRRTAKEVLPVVAEAAEGSDP